MRSRITVLAIAASVALAGEPVPSIAHVPEKCVTWIHEAGRMITRVGEETAVLADTLPYRRHGNTTEELYRFADKTSQIMGTVQASYRFVLEAFECIHPGMIAPEALDELRSQAR